MLLFTDEMSSIKPRQSLCLFRGSVVSYESLVCLCQVVTWVEDLICSQPACPALARLLHSVSALAQGDKFWQAWCVPLLASACVRSEPAAPVHIWEHAVQMAATVASHAAAAELCRRAVNAHPSSLALWKLLLQLHKQQGT